GLNLVIPANKTTALVGSSGSGKSTVVGLLERWYSPTGGALYLDGLDISSIYIQWLRTNIRLVQQEPVLFSGTVYDNVCYGLVGTNSDTSNEAKMKLVKEACKAAYAHDFIVQLPNGYHTQVGERAGMLSGGQKQRIAIARSIVSNPKVLLLDEATSALDPRAEKIVQEALDHVSVNRTTLVIAHKLSTVRKADNIVVMSQGSVMEQGTHEELTAAKGAYYRLVEAQDLGQSGGKDRESSNADIEAEEGEDLKLVLARSATQTRSITDLGVMDTIDPDLGYSLLKCIRILCKEQRTLWSSFAVILVACIAGGTIVPSPSASLLLNERHRPYISRSGLHLRRDDASVSIATRSNGVPR
ncbi:hypothetical protein LTS18_000141, partial [Coniosporium uncinatum]